MDIVFLMEMRQKVSVFGDEQIEINENNIFYLKKLNLVSYPTVKFEESILTMSNDLKPFIRLKTNLLGDLETSKKPEIKN